MGMETVVRAEFDLAIHVISILYRIGALSCAEQSRIYEILRDAKRRYQKGYNGLTKEGRE
jgi:hypothetical protein